MYGPNRGSIQENVMSHNLMLRLARLNCDPAVAGNPWLSHEWTVGMHSTRRYHRAWLWLCPVEGVTVRLVCYAARRRG